MAEDWEPHLTRWTAAGILDDAAASRIRAWEEERLPSQNLRWPILVALAFGAILLAAGVLLFVSAHWDQMSPSLRMSLVLVMTALFHVAGAAAAGRFESCSIALHAAGTAALGGGIALAGQIFNLNEHWPTAVLLWAAGAALAWALLRHWTQGAFVAILLPYWVASEISILVRDHRLTSALPIAVGACGLCFAYLGSRRACDDLGCGDSAFRKALAWIGGIALLPSVFAVALDRWPTPTWQADSGAWMVAVFVPLAVALVLRGREAVWSAAAMLWTLLLALCSGDHLMVYGWCAAGAAGLAAWGSYDARAERINLGILGFAVTVLSFYFSSVMDKLGRSASLIAIGLLFLGGGWLLEVTRRRLLARIHPQLV